MNMLGQPKGRFDGSIMEYSCSSPNHGADDATSGVFIVSEQPFLKFRAGREEDIQT